MYKKGNRGRFTAVLFVIVKNKETLVLNLTLIFECNLITNRNIESYNGFKNVCVCVCLSVNAITLACCNAEFLAYMFNFITARKY